jgi:hypothetical protein
MWCFLGFKKLELPFFLSHRALWEWLRRRGNTTPWQGLPMAYDEKTKYILQIFVTVQLGNGRNALFGRIDGKCTKDFAMASVQQNTKERDVFTWQ